MFEFLWACCVRSSLVIALGVVNYNIWVGDEGIGKFFTLSGQARLLQQDNRHLQEKNDRLQATVDNIETGGDILDRHARENLNMIGPGEKLFKILESR